MNIILSAHLDDEIIGCYSILDTIDTIIYFKNDYRAEGIENIRNTLCYELHLPDKKIKYIFWDSIEKPEYISSSTDTIFLPSKYDLHPLHRKVRQIGLTLPGKKMFYSTEMNTPWLEEESDPVGKRALFEKMYPGEIETISKSDKYFLFKSIKPYDDIIWCSIRFEREGFHCWPAAPQEVDFLRNLHRHKFHFQVDVSQHGDDRDLEFFITSTKIQKWFDEQNFREETSCEMFCFAIKRWLELEYVDRMVRVSCYEDNENGSIVE